MSLLVLALACSEPTASVPAEVPAPPVAARYVPLAEREGLHVRPDAIRWDEAAQTLVVEAHLVGRGVATRKEPVHVGVTVVTESGQEHDLLVHTLFPDTMGQSLLFSTELHEAPKHVLIGAWGQRVEPCDSDRPGCKAFGFVLDHSLASFPSRLYSEGMRQRFLPADLVISTAGQAETVAEVARTYAAPFGVTPTTVPLQVEGLAPGVWTRREDDLGLAAAIAEVWDLPYGQREDLEVPVAVVLPH